MLVEYSGDQREKMRTIGPTLSDWVGGRGVF
jgi:hypothetical protein